MVENKRLLRKSLFLAGAVALVAVCGLHMGFNTDQIITLSAFSLSILGTLLFWDFRLSFAFLGTAIILFTGVATLEEFLHHSSMEIIFFLIGMMVLVGFLKEIGLFTWLLQKALIMKRMSAKRFMVALIFTSGLLACAIDEVSSILFMVMIIFELSDYFEVNPVPFVIASVFATNIGSAGTVIGNPIGIMIAAKANLSFENFLAYAFPLMMVSLLALVGIMFAVFKKQLKELDAKIKKYGPNEILVRLLSIPTEGRLKIGFVIGGATLLLISAHHRLEVLFGLERNTILLIAPLLSSAIIMVWRREKARDYIEKDVEWWTLLFFMFLFAQAGILSETGVARVLAEKILIFASHSRLFLTGTILFGSAFISSALDNVVVVAGSMPVIQSIHSMLHLKSVLWWALLFGACFGGNITIIGSTANIIAIGSLEKRKNISIDFFYWLKIGTVVGVSTLLIILIAINFLPYYR
jgi:Na+/H+ antiporter NhaD/arsenite permease-like protein